MDKAPTTARLEARLPAGIHPLLKRAAEIQGRTVTDFVVTAARAAAYRAIKENQILRHAQMVRGRCSCRSRRAAGCANYH